MGKESWIAYAFELCEVRAFVLGTQQMAIARALNWTKRPSNAPLHLMRYDTNIYVVNLKHVSISY